MFKLKFTGKVKHLNKNPDAMAWLKECEREIKKNIEAKRINYCIQEMALGKPRPLACNVSNKECDGCQGEDYCEWLKALKKLRRLLKMKYLRPTKKMEELKSLEQDAIILAMTDDEIKLNLLEQFAFTGHPVTKDDVNEIVKNPLIKKIRKTAIEEGYLEEKAI